MSAFYLVCFTHTTKGGQSYGSRTITFSEPITGQEGIDLLHKQLASHLKVKALAVLSLTRLDGPPAVAAPGEVERLRAALRNVRQYLVDVSSLLGEPGEVAVSTSGVGGVVARIDAALNPESDGGSR